MNRIFEWKNVEGDGWSTPGGMVRLDAVVSWAGPFGFRNGIRPLHYEIRTEGGNVNVINEDDFLRFHSVYYSYHRGLSGTPSAEAG